MRQIKAAYDIAAVQVGLAKTQADFDAALSSATDAYSTAAASFLTALDAAPADVAAVIATCD